MTFEQLEIFLDLAETHSMAITCNNLNMSKNNVSKSIAKLENDLSVDLFIRTRQGSYLTLIGEQIYNHVKNIFNEKKIIENICLEPQKSLPLTILFTEAHAFLIDEFTNNLKHSSGIFQINLLSMEATFLNNNILSISPDVCLTTCFEDNFSLLQKFMDDYHIFLTKKQNCGLLVNQKFLPPNTSYITFGDLKKYTCVVMSSPTDANTLSTDTSYTEKMIKERNVFFSIVRCNSFTIMQNYLERQNYGLICDDFSCRNIPLSNQDNFIFLPLSPDVILWRILMVKKDSNHLLSINNAILSMQNKYPNEFSIFTNFNNIIF